MTDWNTWLGVVEHCVAWLATGCLKVPIQLQNMRTALQIYRQYGYTEFKWGFCFIISYNCTGSYSSLHAMLLPGYIKLKWRWTTEHTHNFHSVYFTSVFCICVTLYENICSYFSMFIIWNGTVFLHTIFLCKSDDPSWNLLCEIVDVEWCFPTFLCLCDLFSVSVFRRNPKLKPRTADMWRTLQWKTKNVRLHDSSVLCLTLLTAVVLLSWQQIDQI